MNCDCEMAVCYHVRIPVGEICRLQTESGRGELYISRRLGETFPWMSPWFLKMVNPVYPSYFFSDNLEHTHAGLKTSVSVQIVADSSDSIPDPQ